MPKTQKTFYLHDDLGRLLEAVGKRSGASFTRMITAAVVQYLFQDSEGPNDLWMEYAVQLEQGEIEIADMPAQRQQDVAADTLAELGGTKIEPGKLPKMLPPGSRQRWANWRHMLDAEGDDGIEKIINYRAKLRKR